jgi:glyoxylase-like metal-dependent hydrolase (beta-lactamase superfamily II)
VVVDPGMPTIADDLAPLLTTPLTSVTATVAFWHNDSHTLLSGDAVVTMRGAPRFAPDTVDEVAALKTAAHLRSLPVEHLLPGHGLPIHALNVWATRT